MCSLTRLRMTTRNMTIKVYSIHDERIYGTRRNAGRRRGEEDEKKKKLIATSNNKFLTRKRNNLNNVAKEKTTTTKVDRRLRASYKMTRDFSCNLRISFSRRRFVCEKTRSVWLLSKIHKTKLIINLCDRINKYSVSRALPLVNFIRS